MKSANDSPKRTALKKGMSIFKKVLLGNIFLIIVVLVLSGALTFGLVRNYVIETNQAELLDKADLLATGMGRSPDWAQMRKYQLLIDAEILMVDTDYVAIRSPRKPASRAVDAETGLSYTEILSRMDMQIIDSIFAGNRVSDLQQVEFLSEQIVYAGVPLYAPGGELMGALMLFRLLKDVNAIWTRIAVFLVVAAGLSVVAALVLATVLSKGITRPLLIMNDAARRMGEGDYEHRVPILSGDEAGQLGVTLNALSFRLSDVISKLQSEKSKLEQILTSLAEGIVAFDREGRILTHNPAALALLEIGAWDTPDGVNDANADKQKRHVAGMLAVCMDTGDIETASWESASGRAISAVASPVRVPDGAVVGAVCLLRDVSEAQRLEQLSRDYIANVSHELRTPLTGIRGMAEPLIDGMIETEREKQDCYQVIYKETLRLEKLIGEMLDMSRLQDGRLQIEVEPLELSGVLKRAVRSIRHAAEDACIMLTLDAPPPIACVGNEDRIVQVMIILIDNAISFTPRGGEITVFARSLGAKVNIGVRDTGAGIEPKHLPFIWERFYKADKSRMRTTGTGLGLAIAKLVAERMGGVMSVTTELGKGSEFVLTLNAPDDAEARAIMNGARDISQ